MKEALVASVEDGAVTLIWPDAEPGVKEALVSTVAEVVAAFSCPDAAPNCASTVVETTAPFAVASTAPVSKNAGSKKAVSKKLIASPGREDQPRALPRRSGRGAKRCGGEDVIAARGFNGNVAGASRYAFNPLCNAEREVA